MIAKLTAKNQLTLPKAAIEAVGDTEYFEIEVRRGQLVLTPVRIQRADAVRAKLAELRIDDDDVVAAMAWARELRDSGPAVRVAEPAKRYQSAKRGKPRTKRPGK